MSNYYKESLTRLKADHVALVKTATELRQENERLKALLKKSRAQVREMRERAVDPQVPSPTEWSEVWTDSGIKQGYLLNP